MFTSADFPASNVQQNFQQFNEFTTTQVQILINSQPLLFTSADFPTSNIQQNFQQFNIAIYSSILQYIAEFPAI